MGKRKVKKDLSKQQFGRWIVLEQADDFVSKDGKHVTMWVCQCTCENKTIKIVRGCNLTNGHSTSCGCWAKEILQLHNDGNTYAAVQRKGNNYNLDNEYGIGYTSDGREFYFDKEDLDKIKPYTWYINSLGYVIGNKYGDTSDTLMHRLVMNAPDGKQVHHKHHKKNDNRKNELQLCTNQENSRHKEKMKTNTSGVIGVSWSNNTNKWHAQITVDYKNINLGYYDDINEAKIAYDNAKKLYFGDFAYNEEEEYII